MSKESYYSTPAQSPGQPPTGGVYPLKDQYGYGHVPSQYTDEHLEALQRKDTKLKKRIRILRIVSRICTAIFSTVVAVMMGMSIHKFSSTKNIYINGRTAWAKNTKLWPTVMLFSVAAVTVTFNLIILVAYLRSVKTANRVSTVSSIFGVLVFGGHVVVWVSAAALYRYGKDTNGVHNDLWGWSCSKGADKIQSTFHSVVNFDRLCTSSANAWYTSIAEACLEILSVVIYYLAYRRLKHKKKIEVARSIAPQSL
ncbi:hypothetical protein FGG08_005925 [Glutinoglossum americanum]|uniref:MARVEL domain-containing protein n=1 Tax=Glutinoglossum americanum TaxID=1670608 RepID=A0A9P8I8F5_9PEZI|nr:hypothetical protein FGG08_005925 [Glutinoglossum americanum]